MARPRARSPTPKHPHDDEDSRSRSLSPTALSSPQSVGSHKRARLAHRDGLPITNENSVIDEEEEAEGDEEDGLFEQGNMLPEADPDVEEEQLLDTVYELRPDANVFQPGAIVRIKLKDFVTYEKVQMKMGPSLNMIIGPNGTGKSTIVCGICLGLGWPPSTLGRAKEASEFVKHGKNEAYIEIELQGKKGEDNTIITRKIMRENNQSTWTVNGKPSSARKVLKHAQSFNIQVDNLCQFLPQDRVKEFSNLGPQMKLQETERAAAHPSVLKEHKALIELDKKSRVEGADLEQDNTLLKQLEDRQALLKQDVDRLRERKAVEKEIALLNKAKPFIAYRTQRQRHHEAKANMKAAKAELAALRQELQPAMERPEKKKKYRDTVRKCADGRLQLVKDKQDELKKLRTEVLNHFEEELKEIKSQMDSERTAEIARKNDIQKMQQDIATLNKKLEEGPPELDLPYYHNLINENHKATRALMEEITALRLEILPKVEDIKKLNDQIARLKTQLNNLNSKAGQHEQTLLRASRDTHRVWEWLKENKGNFEQEIFGPPLLSCSITNPRTIDALESMIGSNMLAFTCQNRRDYQKFSSMVLGRNGLGVREVYIKEYSGTQAPTLDRQRYPYDPQMLHSMGFDGLALDYVQGPEPVLNMLCHEAALQQFPIAFKDLSPQQTEAAQQSLTRWVSGKTMVAIMRRYGVTSTRMSQIKPHHHFGAQKSNPEDIKEIERKISEWTDNVNELNSSNAEQNTRRDDLLAQVKSLESERNLVELEKSKKQNARGRYDHLVAKKSYAEDQLRTKQQSGGNWKVREKKMQDDARVAATKRARAAMNFADMVTELVTLHNDYVKAQIRYVEAQSDVHVLEEKNKRIIAQEAAKAQQVDELIAEAEELKQKIRRMRDRLENMLKEVPEEEATFLANIPDDKTSEEVEQDIEVLNARLALIHETNPMAQKQYDDRAVKIEELQAKISTAKEGYDSDIAAIAEIRGKWEPKLDTLVAKISTAFSRSFKSMGAAGEVRIHKDSEGYEKWAIEILVKFRDNEPLKVLDGHRQSGGERAVSTVFYLMALQSLAKSPFRVVDEINQGMDPRNERMVHHRMVNIACQENTSQYFLITPKLLPNLLYHPRMKVHCIYSGDWIQEGSTMDYKRYLKAGRKLKAKG